MSLNPIACHVIAPFTDSVSAADEGGTCSTSQVMNNKRPK